MIHTPTNSPAKAAPSAASRPYPNLLEGTADLGAMLVSAIIATTANSIISLIPSFGGQLAGQLVYAIVSYVTIKSLLFWVATDSESRRSTGGIFGRRSTGGTAGRRSTAPDGSKRRGTNSSGRRSTNPNTLSVRSSTNLSLSAAIPSIDIDISPTMAYFLICGIENSGFAWKNLFIFVLFNALYREEHVIGFTFLEFLLLSTVVISLTIYLQFLIFSQLLSCSAQSFKFIMRADIDIFALPIAACFFIICVVGTTVETGNDYVFGNELDRSDRLNTDNPLYFFIFSVIFSISLIAFRSFVNYLGYNSNLGDSYHMMVSRLVSNLVSVNNKTIVLYKPSIVETPSKPTAKLSSLEFDPNLETYNRKSNNRQTASSVESEIELRVSNIESTSSQGDSPLKEKKSLSNSADLQSSSINQDLESSDVDPSSSEESHISSEVDTVGSRPKRPSSAAFSMKDSELFEWTDDIFDDPAKHLKQGMGIFVFKSAFCSSLMLGYTASLGFISVIINSIVFIPVRWAQVVVLSLSSLFFLGLNVIRIKIKDTIIKTFVYEMAHAAIRLSLALLLQQALFLLINTATSSLVANQQRLEDTEVVTEVLLSVLMLIIGLVCFYRAFIAYISTLY